MIYGWLADGVLALHLLFIFFVVLGGLLVLRFRWLIYLHLPAVLWGVLIELNSWLCPLTTYEVRLRELAGQDGYRQSFIDHYLMPIIYPPGLNRDLQLLLAAFVVIINAAVYGILYRHHKSK